MSKTPSATLLIVSALLVLGVTALFRELAQSPLGSPGPAGGNGPERPGAVGTVESVSARRAGPSELPPRVCVDAGYLCAPRDQGGERRVLRWDDGTRRIRIRVPRPQHEDPATARALQSAAASGILVWQRKPFELIIERTDRPVEADIVVRWEPRIGATELGRVETQWFQAPDGQAGMKVTDFVLATRSPFDDERLLAARQVELTAAHEMGHALGLPHSDSPSDVMYPSNTASRLSARDFTSMEALYRLENGALLPRR